MQNNLDVKVADLIDEDTHTWKLHKISTTFELEDVDAILSIPISIICLNDRLLWHHSKSENYEVKSGYYLISKGLAVKTIRNSEAQASCHSFPKSFWDSLWNLEIKNKLKYFLRKCVINSLPVNYTLAKRLQNRDKTCKICGLESEDVEHMLFRCPRSQLVWKQSPINLPGIENITDFSVWWYNLFLNDKHFSESTELLYLSVNIMWQIWKGRNAWCFNQEMLEPTDIVSKALFEYEEYKDLLTSCLAARTSTRNEFCDDRYASIGVTALNSLEKLLYAHGSPIQYVGKTMTAEAIAIRKALECAITLGWKSVATSWEIEVLCEDIWKISSMTSSGRSFSQLELSRSKEYIYTLLLIDAQLLREYEVKGVVGDEGDEVQRQLLGNAATQQQLLPKRRATVGSTGLNDEEGDDDGYGVWT
ncbi:uncharacterized protein LOC142162013 [Nicotiana tabacum]|uniref:Uncharacterized protein LOC142162013 n=1 Tax=Nicotiana tabacum TaxID=4097 RepID=A0AC58RNY5_TOBAC